MAGHDHNLQHIVHSHTPDVDYIVTGAGGRTNYGYTEVKTKRALREFIYVFEKIRLVMSILSFFHREMRSSSTDLAMSQSFLLRHTASLGLLYLRSL